MHARLGSFQHEVAVSSTQYVVHDLFTECFDISRCLARIF